MAMRESSIRRLMPFFSRFFGTVTLGVQAVVIDGQGRVFLVRHSYVPGWHLPGGGVEVGETLIAALARELAEEGNIALTEPPILHGVFLNSRISRRDHVVVYVVRRFRQDPVLQPNYEIIEHGFFHPDALPEDTSRATRRRLAEVLQGAPIAEHW
jgi:8-oxo-dGTP pyrophosphatase MutT (NUDIX family)